MFEINRWNYVFKFYREVQWHAIDLLTSFVPKQLLILDAIFFSLSFFVITVINPEWNNRFVEHSLSNTWQKHFSLAIWRYFSEINIMELDSSCGLFQIQIKQPKYWQPVFEIVKNLYYHSPHFDLKFWTIDNTDTKKCNWWHRKEIYSPINLEEIWLHGNNCIRSSFRYHVLIALAVFCTALASLRTLPFTQHYICVDEVGNSV